MIDWIDVNERLPEKTDKYLIYLEVWTIIEGKPISKSEEEVITSDYYSNTGWFATDNQTCNKYLQFRSMNSWKDRDVFRHNGNGNDYTIKFWANINPPKEDK